MFRPISYILCVIFSMLPLLAGLSALSVIEESVITLTTQAIAGSAIIFVTCLAQVQWNGSETVKNIFNALNPNAK